MVIASNTISKQARIDYIDIFRALGIIFMIMGHIGFGSIFDKCIHAFHMPMFFFISGWFYRKKDISLLQQIGRKAKTLLIPYLCIGAAELVICYLILGGYQGLYPIELFLFDNTQGKSPVPGALWFLTALFITELIYVCIDRVLIKKALNLAVIVISIFGMIATLIIPFRLPWGIDAGCVGVGLFHIGRLWRGSKLEKFLNIKAWQTLLLGIVVSISIMLSPYVNMRSASYNGYPLFWINAVVAIVVGWNLSRYIYEWLKRIGWHRFSQWLRNIGKNSIIYLCLNQICILVTTRVLDYLNLSVIAEKFIVFALVMVGLFILEKIICNTRLKVFIGK